MLPRVPLGWPVCPLTHPTTDSGEEKPTTYLTSDEFYSVYQTLYSSARYTDNK